MKTIVAGSRTINDYKVVEEAIKESGFDITEIVSGMAGGVDTLGILYAKKNHIPYVTFPANWNKHGKAAGVVRNIQMAKYADSLIAVWDGKSRGTGHMIKDAVKKGLKIFVKNVPNNM